MITRLSDLTYTFVGLAKEDVRKGHLFKVWGVDCRTENDVERGDYVYYCEKTKMVRGSRQAIPAAKKSDFEPLPPTKDKFEFTYTDNSLHPGIPEEDTEYEIFDDSYQCVSGDCGCPKEAVRSCPGRILVEDYQKPSDNPADYW